MINNASNLINNVDLKIIQESSKNNDRQNNVGKDKKVEKKNINNDILDLEDIKLEKKEGEKEKLISSDSKMNIIKGNEKENLENIEHIELNELNSIQSSFKEKIYLNTQLNIEPKNQYLTITQTTLGLNSLKLNKKYYSSIISKENDICIFNI